ncbi:hypothetical protein ACEQ8H_001697 [Pleosporales sp. CAS-2024a]
MPPTMLSSEFAPSTAMQSIRNQVGSKLRNMTHYGQPTIEINIYRNEASRNTWVTSYSTMDTIEGNVTITAPHDTRFEHVDIAFVGTCQTFVDTLTTSPSMNGRAVASHRFLVLRQPMAESDFPTPRIFEAGRTYTFPFTFTVPERLLPKSCSHQVSSDQVRECHLMLPPSLGDAELAGFGSTLVDDLAPEMSKITYSVKVRIAQQRGSGAVCILGEKAKKIRIKPALIEQPPLSIDGNSEYRAHHEKMVKKGLFKGKLGTISARTAQPKALVIPGARTTDPEPITTIAKLAVRFDPSEEINEPPRLTSLSTKIKVSTCFASSPHHNFPSRLAIGYDVSRGAYSENVPLSTLCIASASWEKHFPSSNSEPYSNASRRDSGISDCSSTSASEAAFAAGILPASKDYKNGTFYTTQLLVPFTLPMDKNFIPTFHSCLVSRTYTLGMKFGVQGGSGLSLKVPIQICAEGSDTGIENARARSIEDSQLRNMLTPRSIAPPPSFEDVHRVQRTASMGMRNELPPRYLTIGSSTRRYEGLIAA